MKPTRAQAEEALGLALLTYPQRGLPLPEPEHRSGGLVPVAVAAEDAAKIAVLDAWRASGISKSEFARRIGKDEKEARRILDPMHPTKLPVLTEALRALGRRLVVSIAGLDEVPAQHKRHGTVARAGKLKPSAAKVIIERHAKAAAPKG